MGSILLLSELLDAISRDIHEGLEFFHEEPYNYNQDIIDEMLDILDRVELLEIKLSDIDFKGGYRYEGPCEF